MTAPAEKSSQGLHLSPKMGQVATLAEKQGIVGILGSDMGRVGAPSASFRRTLSADMSSKKWLDQNGFSKQLRSSDSSACSAKEDPGEGREGEEGGKMMQGKQKQEQQLDIWNLILSQKTHEEASKSLPPYVHPLVKRSKSCLSERSLEICTESLGSETGSDGFSSSPPSETGDGVDQDKEEHQEQQQTENMTAPPCDLAEGEFISGMMKSNCAAATEKEMKRLFPPPLASLSHSDGASQPMRSVRKNGRLVVEAVYAPSQKNFHAQRQHGRLVLTYLDDCKEREPNGVEEMEEEFGGLESNDEEREQEDSEEDGVEEKLEVEEVETKDIEIVIEDAEKLSSDSMTHVHRLALMIKSYELGNRNPSWALEFNEVVKVKKPEEEDDADMGKRTATPVALPLPPRPVTPRASPGSFNAYEYYWRPKQTAKAKAPTFVHQEDSSSPPRNDYYYSDTSMAAKNAPVQNERQQVLVLRGKKGDYLIPMSKTCKESRGAALLSKPYCIATS